MSVPASSATGVVGGKVNREGLGRARLEAEQLLRRIPAGWPSTPSSTLTPSMRVRPLPSGFAPLEIDERRVAVLDAAAFDRLEAGRALRAAARAPRSTASSSTVLDGRRSAIVE